MLAKLMWCDSRGQHLGQLVSRAHRNQLILQRRLVEFVKLWIDVAVPGRNGEFCLRHRWRNVFDSRFEYTKNFKLTSDENSGLNCYVLNDSKWNSDQTCVESRHIARMSQTVLHSELDKAQSVGTAMSTTSAFIHGKLHLEGLQFDHNIQFTRNSFLSTSSK